MKKRLFRMLGLCLLIATLAVSVSAAENTTEFAGGEGTEDSPYLIANATHLNNVRNYLDAHFKMTADIEFADADFAEGGVFYNDGAGWSPIGSDYTATFTGSFDGDGHTIMRLYQNISASKRVFGGLFGYVSGATIKNLGMVDSNISVATTSGNPRAGGIAGYVGDSTISGCYNTGLVNAESSSSSSYAFAFAGGIVGEVSCSAISECYNTGTVTAAARYSDAGGISSNVDSHSTVSNCYNIGVVSAVSRAGGIVGYLHGSSTIAECYNTGAASSERNAGGIAGHVYDNNSTISSCYYLDISDSGVGNGTDAATKCTEEEMKLFSTFTGFDFDETWTMVGDASYPYPELRDAEMVFVKEPSYIKTIFPSKLEYVVGDDLNVMGGKVTLYYNDGTKKETVDLTSEMVSGFDNTTVGEQMLTVSYGGFTDAFEVKIIAKSAVAIEVAAPNKGSYLEAKESLDVTGGKITVRYNNGASEEIEMTADMVSGFNNGVVGKQTLTATYEGFTDTFEVEIIAKSVAAIDVVTPNKDSYLEAKEALDVTGGKVLVYYNNDTNGETEMIAGMVSGFDNTIIGKQTLTVTYEGFTDTFEIEIIAKSKASIEVVAPAKLAYIEAKEMLDVTRGKVILHYNNDTSEEITLTADMVSGFDNTVVGKQTLTVSYEGFTNTFEIEIVAKSVTAIGVIAPTKLTYIEAKEGFDPAGGSVFVFYNNDTSEMIDLSMDMVSGFDNTVVGEQTLTVSYGGFTDSFKVEIIAKSAIFVALTTEPTKLVYLEGEVLDVSGGRVSVSYNNGTGETIDLAVEMVSGFDSAVVGKQTLTVSYGGKTDTFEIEVVAKSAPSISINSASATGATLTIANNEAGSCYVAVYDNYGKMLSYGLTPVTADAGEVTVSLAPFTTTSSYTVKAFLVDTQGIPACACATTE